MSEFINVENESWFLKILVSYKIHTGRDLGRGREITKGLDLVSHGDVRSGTENWEIT